jgi:hypothetical protein
MSPRFWQVLGYDPNEKVHRASMKRSIGRPNGRTWSTLTICRRRF